MFPTGDIYIGAQFKLGANVHYGWILVNWDAAGTFIVKSYAYEDSPNTSINAGSQGATVILVNYITAQGQGGVSIITTNGGTLQMTAAVLPVNATSIFNYNAHLVHQVFKNAIQNESWFSVNLKLLLKLYSVLNVFYYSVFNET
jgi:hypothetical protein